MDIFPESLPHGLGLTSAHPIKARNVYLFFPDVVSTRLSSKALKSQPIRKPQLLHVDPSSHAASQNRGMVGKAGNAEDTEIGSATELHPQPSYDYYF